MYCKRLLPQHCPVVLTRCWIKINLQILSFQSSHLSLSVGQLSKIISHISTYLISWPLTLLERILSTCVRTLLLLLSMLIEFLCSLIKHIEFASAVGCYMASWAHTQTRTNIHTRSQTHIPALPRTALSIPADSLLIARGLTGSGGVIASEF